MANRSDNFNRADDGATLGTPSDGGSAWVSETPGDTWGIYQNTAYHSSASGSYATTLESGIADCDVSCKVTVFGNLLAARVSDENNYLVGYFDPANMAIAKRESGSFSNVSSVYTGAVSAGDVIRLRCSGTTIELYQNDVLRCSATSSLNQTATRHGLSSQSGSNYSQIDDFAITSLTPSDTTPPTLGTKTVTSAGTNLTATLSESGCTPSSGTGGFSLAGTSATAGAWTISGTTLTLAVTGPVYSGQTVTLSYSRAATTDDIADAAGNFLADFSAAAVTNSSTQAVPLAAGTASFVSSGPGGIAVSATAPTNGTGTLSYQWERNTDGGSYSNLSGATTLAWTDATGTAGHLYRYRCKQTRGAETVTTNAVLAQVYAGGSLTGGGLGGPRFNSPFLKGH